MRRVAPHLFVSVGLICPALLLTAQLLGDPVGRILGNGPGDNVTFVWDSWWMAHALKTSDVTFFRSSYIFWPIGSDLTLHTHAALPSLVGAVLSQRVGLLAGVNAVIGLQLWANFVAAYALGWFHSRRVASSVVAAVLFGWSPYLAGHLLGHFNLVAAWPLPCTALAWQRLSPYPRWRGASIGLLLGATAYIDYYICVYACMLLVALSISDAIRSAPACPSSRWQSNLSRFVIGLAVVAVLVGVVIISSGGGVTSIAGHPVSLKSATNSFTAAWLLALFALAVRLLPQRVRSLRCVRCREVAISLCTAGLVLAAIAFPLERRAIALQRAGDYASTHYSWKSSPGGIDLATLLVNPFGAGLGDAMRSWTRLKDVNFIEGTGTVGVGLIILLILGVPAAVRVPHLRDDLRKWVLVGIVFGAWALGPYVLVAGQRTPLMLPGALIPFIPVLSNARMPGRAVVVVYLALSILAAISLTALWNRDDRRTLAFVVALFAVLEFLPAPVPAWTAERPVVLIELAERPDGAVLELPVGLRDGFGEIGRLDPRIPWFQTLHQKPVAGGFVARLAPSIARFYSSNPMLQTLLRLSENANATSDLPPGEVFEGLRSLGFKYVLLHRDTSSPRLREYVEAAHIHLLFEDARMALYSLP